MDIGSSQMNSFSYCFDEMKNRKCMKRNGVTVCRIPCLKYFYKMIERIFQMHQLNENRYSLRFDSIKIEEKYDHRKD